MLFCLIHRSVRTKDKPYASCVLVILVMLMIDTLHQSTLISLPKVVVYRFFPLCPYLYIAGSSLQVQSPFVCSPVKGRVGDSIPSYPPVGNKGTQR